MLLILTVVIKVKLLVKHVLFIYRAIIYCSPLSIIFWRLSFFLDSFFLAGAASTSDGFGTTVSFSVKKISTWHGLDLYGLIRPWALYVRLLVFGAWLTWMWSTTKWSTSKPLISALLSAFFKSCRTKSQDFSGHLPWQAPHCLHWALRPTPPLNRLNGTISLCSMTFFRNFMARLSGMCLMALPTSRVFLKWTRR